MTARDISGLKAKSASLFPNNTTQQITPQRKRSYDTDVADSALNVVETSPQTISSPVDFLAGLSSQGVPIKNPENVTIINDLSDFPAPSGGIIELSAGVDRSYEIAAKTIDIGSNVFSVNGGTVTIKGLHRVASQITTTSSSPMFSMPSGSLFIESCGLSCQNGNLLNITGGTTLVLDLITVYNCISLGSIADLFICSLRTATVLATQTSGLSFSGNINQFNVTSSLFGDFAPGFGLGWNGVLFNFGTAVFKTIIIQAGTRFFSSPGNTVISGAGTANIEPDGFGSIVDNAFIGDGTYLSGWDEQDIRFSYSNNGGLEDSMADAWITAIDNDLITSIPGQNTPVKANSVYTEQGANRFTTDSTGRCTYVGATDIAGVPINLACSLEPVSNNRTMAVYIARGNDGSGSSPPEPVAVIPETRQIVRTDSGDASAAPTVAQVSLKTGDFFEIWVENQTNSSDIYIRDAKLIIN